MKDELSRGAATANAVAAVVTRLFWGLMVDAPEVHNGAWLSVMLGSVLALPALWLIHRAVKQGTGAPLRIVLLIAIVLDAAGTLECTAFSESCVAFNHVPAVVLMLPLLLAVGRCMYLGGDALGASARVWMRAFVPMLAVIMLFQLPYYRPAWLAPVLGFGMRGILYSALRTAGWIAALGGAAMALCREELKLPGLCANVGIAVAVAMALITLRLMMAPAMDPAGMERRIQLDALLTNGRAPMYLQLPMIVIWFVGMLHLLCFEAWSAMILMQAKYTGLGRLSAGAAVLIVITLLALLPPVFRWDLWRLPAILLSALPLRKGGDIPCAG